MKSAIAIAVNLFLLASGNAGAASLCNCCGVGAIATCTAICETIKAPAGQCIAAIDFDASFEIGPGTNPLYGVTLRDISLGSVDKRKLELFRLLLERSRKGAESDRRAALRARRLGQIDAPAADLLSTRYGDAIVNYYLGVQAYRLAKSNTR